MSLLFDRHAASVQMPTLSGREILEDPKQPEKCTVKGTMLVSRKKFLCDQFGPREFEAVLAALSADVRVVVETPDASSWIPFGTLVACDKAIYGHFKARQRGILTFIGAASAEYSIPNVSAVLLRASLLAFFNGIAQFHERFQRYGRVAFLKTQRGGVMNYTGYHCYSPVFCASAVGFFLEAILRHGGRDPHVHEATCHCRGDRACRYEMTWT